MKRVYSIPYKGSKQKIASQLIECMPSARCFVDAMAGGGAMTSCAILSGKYETFIMNDIEHGLSALYKRALLGDFGGMPMYDFISRDRFYAEKDESAFVRFVWSFGNNGRDYLYSRQIEPLKQAIHNVLCYNDYKPLASMGVWLPELEKKSIADRRAELKELFFKYAPQSVVNRFGNELYRLQHLERIERMCALHNLKNEVCMQNIQFAASSYEALNDYVLDDDCVFYYDIPYQGTNNYGIYKEKSLTFDKGSFCDFIRQSPYLCFVSEYTMPDDFVCVKEINTITTMCATGNKKTTERLFVHESKIEKLNN